jgi:prepilin-type N-terminal cleavage/methylation domain-containing protein
MNGQEGFSLTELLVSTMVMGLAMGALFTGLSQTQVFYESYDAAMTLRQEGRVAMARMLGDLRTAGYDMGNVDEAIGIADSRELQFVGDIDDGEATGACDASFENATNGGAERVTYELVNDLLIRTIDCYDGSSWTVGVETATVLSGLAPGLLAFGYQDVSGMELSTDDGPLSADLRNDVRSVTINLVFEDLDQKVGAANETEWNTLNRRVRLYNAGEMEDIS